MADEGVIEGRPEDLLARGKIGEVLLKDSAMDGISLDPGTGKVSLD